MPEATGREGDGPAGTGNADGAEEVGGRRRRDAGADGGAGAEADASGVALAAGSAVLAAATAAVRSPSGRRRTPVAPHASVATTATAAALATGVSQRERPADLVAPSPASAWMARRRSEGVMEDASSCRARRSRRSRSPGRARVGRSFMR